MYTMKNSPQPPQLEKGCTKQGGSTTAKIIIIIIIILKKKNGRILSLGSREGKKSAEEK